MITANNVSFWYRKKKQVFRDISFSIEPGHIHGLLGKNGSGKTTLLKLLSGLSFPVNGTINIDGWEPSERKPSFLSEVFFVPEEIVLPATGVKRFIDVYSPFYKDFDHDQVHDYLARFELSAKSKLTELSLGQKKKFIIAFALATNVRYMFLDEPVNGLDIPSKAQFRSILAGCYSPERTIIISTHMIRDLESMIDRIIIINEGKVLMNNDIEPGSGQVSFTGESDLESLFNRIISQTTSKEFSDGR